MVVDNGGVHGAVTVSRAISLGQGTYRVNVRYFEVTGSHTLSAQWRTPGSGSTVVLGKKPGCSSLFLSGDCSGP
jgi:hypothetical protein